MGIEVVLESNDFDRYAASTSDPGPVPGSEIAVPVSDPGPVQRSEIPVPGSEIPLPGSEISAPEADSADRESPGLAGKEVQ